MPPCPTRSLPIPCRRPLAAAAALALTLGACDAERSLAPDDGQVAARAADADPTGLLTTPQRIAFVSYRNGQYDIYRMDATGQNVLRLTSSPLAESDPAWSLDNKRVALVRPRTSASNKTRRDLYIVNADGSNGHWARSLTCDCDLAQPSWSPDGSRLVLTMSLNGTNYVAHLVLATGQLGAYSTGYGGLPGTWPHYTKSGQIVYLGPTMKTVFRMNGDGSNIKAVYTAATSITQPALSPDGSKLAFVRLVDEFFNTDLFVRTLATGATAKVAGSPSSDAFPSWSPDGSRITFSSGRSGVTQIYTMSPSGGNVTQITHTNTAEAAPAWSH